MTNPSLTRQVLKNSVFAQSRAVQLRSARFIRGASGDFGPSSHFSVKKHAKYLPSVAVRVINGPVLRVFVGGVSTGIVRVGRLNDQRFLKSPF